MCSVHEYQKSARADVSDECGSAFPFPNRWATTLAMETFSPCAPPPKGSLSEPSSPKVTPQKKSLDEQQWIRARSRHMETSYRLWVERLKAKTDQSVRERCLTSAERSKEDAYPSASQVEPAFQNDRGSVQTMIFARKYPHLMPRGRAEIEEFERRVWFLGISLLQGLEFRRRSREAGANWP